MTKFKRIQILLPLTLAALTAAASAFAGGSTGGTGGGNAPKSTDAEVEKAVNELIDIEASVGSYFFSQQLFNPAYAHDPVLKRALQLGVSKREIALDNGKKLIWEDSGNFQRGGTMMPQLQDHCYDIDGKESEASTNFAPMSPICFNRTLLRNYSPTELRLQLLGLVYHERVHQMQARPTTPEEIKAREAEAEAVQKQVLKYAAPVLPYLDHITELRKEKADKNVSWTINLINLRPNGFYKVKSGRRSLTVACSRDAGNLINLDGRMNGEADMFVAPGGVTVVPTKREDGKKEFVAVACLDAPRLRCSIGKLNTTYVFYAGDARSGGKLETARARMRERVNAGYCEDVTAKGSEEEQKNGPEGETYSAE